MTCDNCEPVFDPYGTGDVNFCLKLCRENDSCMGFCRKCGDEIEEKTGEACCKKCLEEN